MLQFAYLFLGILLLYYGGEYLLKSSVSIARFFSISPLVIGITIVSASTSSPELFANIISSIKGNDDFIVSNVIGSNILNIALCIAIVGGFLDVKLSFKEFKAPLISLFFFSFLILLFSFDFKSYEFFKSPIGRFKSIFLITCFVFYIIYIIKYESKNFNFTIEREDKFNLNFSLFLLIFSILLLYFGSKILVESATYISRNIFNLGDKFVGIFLIAFGTSVPEITVSILAVLKKERAIAFGNIIGSNIFNLAFILGVNGIIRPFSLSSNYIVDYSIMFILSIILFFIIKINGRIGKFTSLLFFLSYVIYIIYVIYTSKI